MPVLLALVLVGLAVALLVYGARTLRREAPAPPPSPDGTGPFELEDGLAILTLDVDDVDPSSAAVQRIVDDVAVRAFNSVAELLEVEVRTRSGQVLGRRRRSEPRLVEMPIALFDPHMARGSGPDPQSTLREGPTSGMPGVARDPGPPPASKPLADRFALPDSVSPFLTDRDDLRQLVDAILRAAGHDVRSDNSVLTAGDTAVVVMAGPIGEPVGEETFNQAFRRFAASGARRGLMVTAGFMDPKAVRRREMLEPSFLHAGPDGIQRMCDAVEAGADPLAFAAAPPLTVP